MTTIAEKSTTAAAEQTAGPHLDPAAESAVVDHDVLRDILAGRWAEQRRQARRLAADPRLHIAPGTHWSEHREKTFDNLSILAESDAVRAGLPASLGGSVRGRVRGRRLRARRAPGSGSQRHRSRAGSCRR